MLSRELDCQQIQARSVQTLLFAPSRGQPVDEIVPSRVQNQVDAVVLALAVISPAMARTCASPRHGLSCSIMTFDGMDAAR